MSPRCDVCGGVGTQFISTPPSGSHYVPCPKCDGACPHCGSPFIGSHFGDCRVSENAPASPDVGERVRRYRVTGPCLEEVMFDSSNDPGLTQRVVDAGHYDAAIALVADLRQRNERLEADGSFARQQLERWERYAKKSPDEMAIIAHRNFEAVQTIGAERDALQAELVTAREAIASIYRYGADTMSGPMETPPDLAQWYREGVREMVHRARAFLSANPSGELTRVGESESPTSHNQEYGQ